MIVLTLRTDKPEAELGLYDGQKQLAYHVWQAHRQLAETLHTEIENFLKQNAKKMADIQGIVVYKGPGSFTGLRIGLSVANALAYSLDRPIIGASDNWVESGIDQLLEGKNHRVVTPEYGAPVRITLQKK